MTAMMSTDAVSTVRAKSCVDPRFLVAKPGVDGHEGRRQARDDEDREDELGQRERGVVDVELAPGAEGARERPVADEAHDVARERECREQDGTRRDERESAVAKGRESPVAPDERPHDRSVGAQGSWDLQEILILRPSWPGVASER